MPGICHHERESSVGYDYYTNTMKQTKYYFISQQYGVIPVYDVTTPNLVLPDRFYDVYMGKDKKNDWHFISSLPLPLPPAPAPAQVVAPPAAQQRVASASSASASASSASSAPPPVTSRLTAPPPVQQRVASASAPVQASPPSQIPSHIFNAFVEMAISKKETCSITLEELTLGNVGMTPCGHLFDKNALHTALRISKKCPQCRAPAKVSQIQS